MKKYLVAAALSLAMVSGTALAAVPSVQQIESAMSQGNWQQADQGLAQVLEAHPNNARAHYLYAQVLDREGRYADALAQIQQAKALDPQVRFTTPARFAQIEAKLRADAARVSTNNTGTGTAVATTGRADNPFAQQQAAPAAAMSVAPQRHGPSMGAWIGIVIVIVAIAFVLRWTVRRAKTTEDTRAGDDRRDQLKRATDLLTGVRSLKLDVRLSTAPGHEALEKELEGFETQVREQVENLSSRTDPVPPYQIEDLERQFASFKARAEGRPDPNAAASAPASAAGGDSPYAREADAAFGRQPYPPQPQPQPQVIVQQGGGMGGGMGGLLTGVLLGQMLGGSRERVIERDVPVDDEGRRIPRGDPGNGGGLDFGQGSNDWNDGSSGGVDLGSNDDSGGGWDNNS